MVSISLRSTTVVALVLTLAVSSCGKEQSGALSEARAQTETGTRPIPVAVQTLAGGTVESAVRTWGTVRPAREANILSELSGRVAAVHAALGDRVTRGKVLLEIDPGLYIARTREAESRLESARLSLERAIKDLERREAMAEKGTVSDSELEGARTVTAEAHASFSSAQASLEQAKKNLDGARLRAPFDGHVASRLPDVGSTVNPGMPLLTIVNIEELRVEALISEQDLVRVQVGGEAAVTVDAAPGKIFSGTVVAIGPQTDSETKQFPIEIHVENPADHPLKGGMVARVEIVYETLVDAPLLPVDAVVEDHGEQVFFVVNNGVAHRRRVVAGPRQGQLIGLLDGAAVGDTVVVLGQARLTDKAAVTVEEIR